MHTTQASDGTDICYDDTGGDGQPVVLVHGITESHESLGPVADGLAAAGYRVVTLDLRGHGKSANAERYDLAAMSDDVAAVISATGVERPHLIGHSLGGVVVSAAGALLPVRSVVNVDQALQLGAFKEMLTPVEAMLRDPASFPTVMAGLFDQLAGSMLTSDQRQRLTDLRRPQQAVVLGVWDLIFTQSADDIDATVEGALAGYRDTPVSYLSLFGADPGKGYGTWIAGQIPGALTETWSDHGHYPHLVDTPRFLERLEHFWTGPPK